MKDEQEPEQLKIPGSEQGKEDLLEKEMDGYIKIEGKIADLKTLKKKHKGHVDQIMIALGRKVCHYKGKKWERAMKLSVKAEKDAEETKAAKDDEEAQPEKFEPKAAAAAS